MRDVWNKDPAAWEALAIGDRLEAMRKWYCTGPSGQCASSMNTRETLNRTIREVQHEVATAKKPSYRDDERLGEALSVMLTELSDARTACAKMAEKPDDEGMRLYHEGQADAYLMVKRGVEKQLAKLTPAEDCRSVGPF